MTKTKISPGFSLLIVILGLFIAVLIGIGGWYIWQKDHKDTLKHRSNSSSTPTNTNSQTGQQSDPYEGWETYTNSTYGISFKYPADWKVDEVDGTTDAPSAAKPITVRFTVNVERNQDAKYNNTVAVEVLNDTLSDAEAWYDKSFSGGARINKETGELKGRRSVQYTPPEGSNSSKLYLFDASGKTYLFRSLNETLNVQTDADYWAKFDKVFDSFEINN